MDRTRLFDFFGVGKLQGVASKLLLAGVHVRQVEGPPLQTALVQPSVTDKFWRQRDAELVSAISARTLVACLDFGGVFGRWLCVSNSKVQICQEIPFNLVRTSGGHGEVQESYSTVFGVGQVAGRYLKQICCSSRILPLFQE